MGWERRGNGSYYYRKRREGGRVVSDYCGTGEMAEIFAMLDAIQRGRREEAREAWRREREAIRADDRLVADVGEAVLTLTRAWMLAAGCHTHHGTWRRRCDGDGDEPIGIAR